MGPSHFSLSNLVSALLRTSAPKSSFKASLNKMKESTFAFLLLSIGFMLSIAPASVQGMPAEDDADAESGPAESASAEEEAEGDAAEEEKAEDDAAKEEKDEDGDAAKGEGEEGEEVKAKAKAKAKGKGKGKGKKGKA